MQSATPDTSTNKIIIRVTSNHLTMDHHFSEQLANLQRAASRAGRDDETSSNNNNTNNNDGHSHRRDDNNTSYQQQHRSHGGGGGRRDDRYYNDRASHHRSDHDHQSRKRGRDGDDNTRDARRSYDDRGRFYNNHRGDNFHGNNRYDNNGGRGGGRGYGRGDRWRNDDHGRNNNGEQNSSSEQQSTTLAELVNHVKSSYQASQSSNSAMKDANLAKGGKRRHIALLFLTIDDLPHEHVWKEWLKSSCSSTEITEPTTKASEKDNSSSSSSNENPMVSVLCHAKFPDQIKSEWLRQRHLIQQSRNNSDNSKRQQDTNADSLPRFHSHRPEWGSVDITRAMIDLMEEALRIGTGENTHSTKYLSTPGDELLSNHISTEETKSAEKHCEQDIPPVDRFIFVSESCLPVTTLEEVELALFGPKNASDSSVTLYDKSWVNARSTPNNGYARQLQWDAIRTDNIPQNFIWKADQWMVLTRLDAEAVASLPSKHLNGRQLWPAFRKCRASDEIYFPTTLSILGIVSRQDGEAQIDDFSKGESCAGQIRRRRVTYCDWSLSAKNPASFTSQDWKYVVQKARGEGCLFARKFVLFSSLRDGAKKNPQPVDKDGEVSVDDWITIVVKKHDGSR